MLIAVSFLTQTEDKLVSTELIIPYFLLIIITFLKPQDVVFMVVSRSSLPVTATCVSLQIPAPMWLQGQAGQTANLAGNHFFFFSPSGCFPLVPSGSSLGSLPQCRMQGSMLWDGSSSFSATAHVNNIYLSSGSHPHSSLDFTTLFFAITEGLEAHLNCQRKPLAKHLTDWERNI